MTEEQFQAAILAQNPEAKFIRIKDFFTCSPTEMRIGNNPWTKVVVGLWDRRVMCFGGDMYPDCRPLPKAVTRCLPPAECAGKWLVLDVEGMGQVRTLIDTFSETHLFCEVEKWITVESLAKKGYQIADTPISEPRPFITSELK